MKDNHRIVICGVSIYILAIEAGLSALTKNETIRIDPCSKNSAEDIKLLKPDVVIVEKNSSHSEIMMEILLQDIPVIMLDVAQQSTTFLTKDLEPQEEIRQLSSIIEGIVREPTSFSANLMNMSGKI